MKMESQFGSAILIGLILYNISQKYETEKQRVLTIKHGNTKETKTSTSVDTVSPSYLKFSFGSWQ